MLISFYPRPLFGRAASQGEPPSLLDGGSGYSFVAPVIARCPMPMATWFRWSRPVLRKTETLTSTPWRARPILPPTDHAPDQAVFENREQDFHAWTLLTQRVTAGLQWQAKRHPGVGGLVCTTKRPVRCPCWAPGVCAAVPTVTAILQGLCYLAASGDVERNLLV